MDILTRFALGNDRLVLVIALLIAIVGPLSYGSHPSREDPKITIRTAVVTAQFPGMAPNRIEDLITRKIEEKVREIPEVEHIEATARTGSTTVKALVYERYADMAPIWQDLRNKMSDLAEDLPEGTLGPYVNDDYGSVAMATVAMTAEGFSLAEMREAARSVRNELYAVAGTRKVELFGVEPQRIFIEVDNVQIAQLGLSVPGILDTLKQQNIILPGGAIQVDGRSMVIEPSGNFQSLEDIANLPVDLPDSEGQVVYIRDFASIRHGYQDPPRSPAFFNGEPAIVISVSMIDQYDSARFGRDLKAKIRHLENALPIGYQMRFITFQPDDIATAVEGVTINLMQTVAIVLFVVIAFLGLRTGVIVGLMVPLTMLLAILVMRQTGIELERMSLATLIISLGLLVDNGIVMAEEISRRLSLGEERRSAVLGAARSLSMPLLTSSVTTILAFMPLMLAESAAGEYTRAISLVILITLLGSWVLALTVTPLLCLKFLKPGEPVDEAHLSQRPLNRAYRGLLGGILSWRAPFLLGVVAAMAASIWGFQFVSKIFFPASERTQFQIILEHEVGTNAHLTQASVAQLSAWLRNTETNPEVVNHIAYVASGGPRFYLALDPPEADPHRAYFIVNVKNPGDVPGVVRRARAFALENLPQLRAQVKRMSMGPAESGLVEYRLVGTDASVLSGFSETLKSAMRAEPFTVDVRDDWENRTIKVLVQVDQNRARRAGVSSQDVAQALNAILSGTAITDYRQGDLTIPVVMRSDDLVRTNMDRLRTLNIASSSGAPVPLLRIANFSGVAEFAQIQRRDLERVMTVSGKSTTLTAAAFDKQLEKTLAGLDVPASYRIEKGGELESSATAQQSLFAFMPMAFALMILVLVGQFNSLRRPLAILTVIPLVIVGVTIGLLAAPGANFGFMAMLGMLSLAGIVINNAIVLIERIDEEREKGKAVRDAILAASVVRLRPILMTTVTTVAGLAPIIIARDVLFYDLAIVLAGGLLVATILTLGVVPVLYSLLFREPKPA